LAPKRFPNFKAYQIWEPKVGRQVSRGFHSGCWLFTPSSRQQPISNFHHNYTKPQLFLCWLRELPPRLLPDIASPPLTPPKSFPIDRSQIFQPILDFSKIRPHLGINRGIDIQGLYVPINFPYYSIWEHLRKPQGPNSFT